MHHGRSSRLGRRLVALLSGIVVVVGVSACTDLAATAAPTTGATTSAAPTETQSAAPATPEASAAETQLATVPPPAEPSPGPFSSLPPLVETLKVRRTADCLGDNGTGTVGSIRLTWTASGTTGVRVSIDPPSPDVAYDYGYADYAASGSAIVPFACDPPKHDAKGNYHLYVVTTLHERGAAYYRYAKVYEVAPVPT
jgi:hypothetical protein